MLSLDTYGDLKTLIKSIKNKAKGEELVSMGKSFALDQVLGFIPGASNVKTGIDFFRAATRKPDTKKTGTWLDKLDLDDEMVAIIDDTVEAGFLEALVKSIEDKPNNEKLSPNFNMNDEMADFLKNKYKQRTIVGFKNTSESKMQNRFQKLAGIQEATISAPPAQKAPAKPQKVSNAIKSISNDLKDQTNSFNNVKSAEQIEQLLDVAITGLSDEVKKSPTFKTAVKNFARKALQL